MIITENNNKKQWRKQTSLRQRTLGPWNTVHLEAESEADVSLLGLVCSDGGPALRLSYFLFSYFDDCRGFAWYVGYLQGIISPLIYLSPKIRTEAWI